MFAVPTTPAARLSEATINPRSVKSLSCIATTEKDKFVIKTKTAPIMRVNFTPNLLTNRPPTKKPTIAAITATTFTT